MIELDNYLISLVEWIELMANFISVLIIAGGIIVASVKVLQTVRRPDLKHYNQARLAFSRYLVLALEFQLAADIVRTAVKPSWTDLGILAVVAGIRTFLNFFLQREMKEEEGRWRKPMSPHGNKPTDLGYERTRLAADRTLMAWIRTSVSMISFGFTIFKFFMYLRESDILSGQLPLQGPRNLGLGLVGLGTFLLGMAIVEYLLYQRWLGREMKQKFPLSTALIAALLITVIGILALFNLLFNVGPL